MDKQWVKTMKNKDEIRFNVRTTEQQKRELKKLAKVTGISQSDIIRDAVAEKVASLNALLQSGEKVSLGVVTR